MKFITSCILLSAGFVFGIAVINLFFFVIYYNSVDGTIDQVVKPLLQERTRKKIKVLSANGREELLQVNFAALKF
jgi:hypothetical protein